jgi:uncharacterized integral membrane protein (TIGR00698 family)
MHANYKGYLPGIALCVAVATIAFVLARFNWLQAHAIGPLTVAILLGILIGNTVFPRIASSSLQGVLFSKQRLLQLGIILYGFRLTFTDIADIGADGVVIDFLVLASTFALAWFSGRKLLGLDATTVVLIGAGSSICGAAASCYGDGRPRV